MSRLFLFYLHFNMPEQKNLCCLYPVYIFTDIMKKQSAVSAGSVYRNIPPAAPDISQKTALSGVSVDFICI
ncbi:hypothetical protein Q0Q93_14635 [Escherichia marmotae]